MDRYTLGLDLGTSSIGWAIVADEPNGEGGNIVAGSRVFPEGVDRETSGLEKSKNEARRDARGMRRQHDRKARRKKKLAIVLRDNGLLPKKESDMKEILALNPYQLRRKGLDEDLSLFEFGCALFHLNQRRGFKSNRKEQKKEDGVVYEGINALREQMEQAGSRTLGEHFCGKGPNGRIRNHYLLRAMVEEEFNLLWARQSQAQPEVLTEDKREEIREAIFYQRPLKPSDDKVGMCSLEPEERRCPRASWYAQRFRVLQEVNNIRVLVRGGSERVLSNDSPSDERGRVLTELGAKKELKIEKLHDLLDLRHSESVNVDQSKRTKILGNSAEAGLRRVFKKRFDEDPAFYINEVYESLIEDEEEVFTQKARCQWSFSEETIQDLFKLASDQPKGYMNFSKKAVQKLLPYLEAGDHLPAAIEKAGYKDDGAAELLDRLPLPAEVLPNLTNPIVRKALYEVRRVVNAIVREYGKPERIVVELARDTKGSAKERNEQLNENRRRERRREEIREKIISQGLANPSSTDILKQELWEECGGTCPFTGRCIGFDALFRTGEVQIEHILPYSRSLDDSKANKTLCYADENKRKGNQTPFEVYSRDPSRWEELQVRLAKLKMPYTKRRKFTQKQINLDECISRQLNDTRYISRQVRTYLKCLVEKVDVTRGQVTAELRWRWGLDSILNPDGDFKNRDDHRHHAIDAVVCALTTHSHLQTLSRKYQFKNEGQAYPLPWESFREEVKEVVENIIVSHRATRKISGALHEETNYGPTEKPGQYAYRKPLAVLTPAALKKIRDPKIRELAEGRLEEHGGDIKKAFAEPLYLPNKNGPPVPVRSVRLTTAAGNMIGAKNPEGKEYRYLAPGNNHHISFFEIPDGSSLRLEGIVTNMFEAAQIAAENGRRRKNGQPDLSVICRSHPRYPDARFLFSLCKNDTVILETPDQGREICRLQTFSVEGAGTTKRYDLRFRLNTAATIDSQTTLRRIRSLKPEKVRIRKIDVAPLGRISEAHD
jgi:CRISPR-associated endonuclease Csn1